MSFDRQQQLLRIELFRAAAELRALQLAQEVAQPIHLRQRVVAFGDYRVALCDRRVALCARRRYQRLQRVAATSSMRACLSGMRRSRH